MKAISSKSPSSRRRKIAIISVIILALIGAGVYAYLANKQQEADNNRRLDTGTIKQEQVKETADKSQSVLPSKDNSDSKRTDPSTQPSTEAPASPPEKPVIERAGGDPTIKVVATFRQASSGTCELQFSKSGQQTLSYTSNIVISSSYYTCAFSIQRSTLPTAGPWSVTIIHHTGSSSTRSDVRDLE